MLTNKKKNKRGDRGSIEEAKAWLPTLKMPGAFQRHDEGNQVPSLFEIKNILEIRDSQNLAKLGLGAEFLFMY